MRRTAPSTRGGRPRGRAALLALLAMSLPDAGCDLLGPHPSAISISPGGLSFASLGVIQQLRVDVKDRRGGEIGNPDVKWSSDNEGVATVDDKGRVTSVGAGSADVTAKSGGVSTFVLVTVRQLATSLQLSKKQDTLTLGSTRALSAVARDSNQVQAPTPALSWRSLDTASVTVDGAGNATARSYGWARVVVASGALADTMHILVPPAIARVRVQPAADTLSALTEMFAFGVEVTDSAGGSVERPKVTWSSLDPSVARVDEAGNVTALSGGSARIRASAGALADTALVLVRQRPASISVDPPAITLAVGSSAGIAATVRDPLGFTIPNAAVLWYLSQTGNVVVFGNGTIIGVNPGSALITGALGGLKAAASITVTP